MPDKPTKTAKKPRKKAKKKKKARKKRASPKRKSKPNPEVKVVGALDEVRAEKKRLKRRLRTLDAQEKKIQTQDYLEEKISAVKTAFKKVSESDYVRQISVMPEPVKYSVLFILIIIFFVIFVASVMIFFYIIYALSYQPSPVSVQADIQPTITNPTSTTLSSTTTQPFVTSSTTVTTSSTSSSTTNALVCTPPYIRYGLGCCLDVDGNSICDNDEVVDSTTTSTLSTYIRCFRDTDCGPTRVEYTCDGNTVLRSTITHFCRNQGSRASSCDTNYVEETIAECTPTQQCYIDAAGVGKCKSTRTPSNFVD